MSGGFENSQSAHDKHQTNTNLLPPVQVELSQLRHGDDQHPYVEGNADGGVGPADGADVDAGALVLAVPLGPEVADGLALEDGDGDEDGAEDDVEDDGGPEDGAGRVRGEDAQVEEEQRQLQQRDLQKVQDGHDVEELAEARDALKVDGPNVLAEPVGRQPVHVDDGAGDARDDGGEDEPVVEADLELGVNLVHEPLQDEDARYDAKGVREDNVLGGLVSYRRVAVGHGYVFGDCEFTVMVSFYSS